MTGHLKGLKTLVKIIETASLEASTPTKVNHIIARRTIAVNALKRVAIMNPTEIRPILLAIALNPVESAEVRLDWVQGNGQKDWANLSWVHDGDTLQSIDSNGPASNDVVDLGW